MGCSNSVGISKPTTMTSSGSFSRKSGQLEVTQLRTYCLHFSKPSTTLGLAPKAVSAIKKHHIFSSGEFGGETPQSEIHRDVAVVRAAPPVRGKTMVKLTSIDQPVNQEAESTPNNRRSSDHRRIRDWSRNHITSREGHPDSRALEIRDAVKKGNNFMSSASDVSRIRENQTDQLITRSACKPTSRDTVKKKTICMPNRAWNAQSSARWAQVSNWVATIKHTQAATPIKDGSVPSK